MLIKVEDASKLVFENLFILQTESIELSNASGRVLAENLVADRNFPPFDRVMMDGIALQHAALLSGKRRFKIEGIQAAGSEKQNLADPEACLEIMTGAILSGNCDIIIPYEQVEINDGFATVTTEDFKAAQHIHKEATDRKIGDVIVNTGTRIGPAEIGIAATIGKSKVLVNTLPRIAILSTGDELVEIDQTPELHQIRKSNVHMIRSLVATEIGPADLYHVNDEKEAVRSSLASLINHYDILLMSGGVSKGKFDLLPDTLTELGVEKLFHRVKQRPGKPFWFGKKENTFVFAFPGNPVSTFMCAIRYLLPWWDLSNKQPVKEEYAELTEDHTFKPDLQYFLQVKLKHEANGKLMATPVSGKGSGDLANLCNADAFLELPTGRDLFKAGEAFRLWRFR